MKCKVCLKEEHFCSCVGAQIKHKKYSDHIQGSTRIEVVEKNKSPLHPEILPGPKDSNEVEFPEIKQEEPEIKDAPFSKEDGAGKSNMRKANKKK